jgi:alpha-tubulin suppressor-like RCC1 family protein
MSKNLHSRRINFVLLLGILLASFQNCGPGFEVMNSDFESATFSPPGTPTPQLGMLVANASAKKSTNAIFELNINQQSQPVVLRYETADGTALKAADYFETKGSITIPAGETRARIVVPTMSLAPELQTKSFALKVAASIGKIQEAQKATAQIFPSVKMAQFKKLSTNSNSVCGITLDDKVVCSGGNDQGQLGNGSFISTTTFTEVPGLAGAKDIALGFGVSCAITAQNRLACWGVNHFDLNLPRNLLTPTEVPGLINVSDISASIGICAIAGGRVSCFSDNLGPIANSLGLQTIPGLDANVRAVSVGAGMGCAITANNTVRCFGEHDLVLGTQVFQTVQTAREIIGLAGVKAISMAENHACVITAQDTVSCFGYNIPGTGGALVNSTAPLAVPGLVGVRELMGSSNATCALLANNTVQCFGTRFGAVPIALPQFAGALGIFETSPINVNGINSSFCARFQENTVKCLGTNELPAQPTGLIEDSPLWPTNAQAIASGAATCALMPGGTVKCWGRGNGGQLGNNANLDSNTPVDVMGIVNAKAIAVRNDIGCAITAQDTLRCWGTASSSQLAAAGAGAVFSAPVEIPNLGVIRQVVIGSTHICILNAQEVVLCWGSNRGGQTSSASTANSGVPVTVAGLAGVKAIAAGDNHTCAIDGQNRVSCWGFSVDGVLGVNIGGLPNPNPVSPAGLGPVKAIAAGRNHNCAITIQDTVRCWGGNTYGQIGSPSVFSSFQPVEVAGVSAVTRLVLADNFSCAFNSRNQATCWGRLDIGASAIARPGIPTRYLENMDAQDIVNGTWIRTSRGIVRRAAIPPATDQNLIQTIMVLN